MTPTLDHREELLAEVRLLAEIARREDLGERGDLTAGLLDANEPSAFLLLGKQTGVFCGRMIVETILSVFDPRLEMSWLQHAVDGGELHDPTELAVIRGPLGAVLAVERTLLNFLQHLCGVATLTRKYVVAVAGTRAAIYDTRKTLPGWRLLDKYAVRCGGGHNHRIGLHDAILIKDNHLAGIPVTHLPGAVFEMLNRAATLDPPPAFVAVEAASLEQVEQLFKVLGIHVILLDNFAVHDLRRAVRRRDELGLAGKVELEASGGVNLETVRTIAETGVERISVGAITHSAPSLDLSLERLTG
ncbi:MAG TPA: carboxylating nicotinate-nucleotide diphosphorylase [Phycisphaerae bacterium]